MKPLYIFSVLLLSSFLSKAQPAWTLVDTNTALIAYSIASTDTGFVFTCNKGLLYRSTQNGDTGTFLPVTTAPQVGSTSEVYAYGEDLYLLNKGSVNNQGVWRSADNGASWTQSKKGFTANDLKHLEGIVFADTGCMVILVYDGTNPNKYYVSNDHGSTWTLRLSIPSSAPPRMLNIVRKDSTLYLFDHYDTYKSTNNGLGWSQPSGYFPASLLFNTVVLSNGTFMMKTGDIIMSSADGYTWKQVTSTGIPAGSWQTTDLLRSPASDTMYLTTSDGTSNRTLVSGDKGVTWNPFETGLPAIATANRIYYADQLHLSTNGYLFFAPDHGPVYRTNLRVTKPFKAPKVPKPVDTMESVSNSETLNMAVRVYPDPATDVINVNFRQEEPGTAAINITDLSGMTVTTAQLPTGRGMRSKMINISRLPVGVYILHISTPTGQAAIKFVK